MSDWSLKELIAPGAIIALGAWGFTHLNGNLSGLDEKIDRRSEAVERRVSETNQRIDRLLEQQAATNSRLSEVKVDLGYVRSRLDKVAEKLQVSEAPSPFQKADIVAGGLTDSQVSMVWQAIKSSGEIPFADNVTAIAGQNIPADAKTKQLPATVVSIVPKWKDFDFTVAKNGLAIVDPATKKVDAVLR